MSSDPPLRPDQAAGAMPAPREQPGEHAGRGSSAPARATRPGPPARRGLLLVVSAPSGTGKTTIVERLVLVVPDLVMSRSYTSRPAREGEIDGIDYNFVSRQRFEEMVAEGDFLEWASVFGNLYGTCASDVERNLAEGRDIVLVIDVQGARQVRERASDMVSVFMLPPSFDVLEQRLRGRSKDSEEAMQRRLTRAREEVAGFVDYDFVVVNDELDSCVDRLRAIVLAERATLKQAWPVAEQIVSTFIRKDRE